MRMPGFTAERALVNVSHHCLWATGDFSTGPTLVLMQDCRCPSDCPGYGGVGNCICGCVKGSCVCKEYKPPPPPSPDETCLQRCLAQGISYSNCRYVCDGSLYSEN